ncbi:MULTISPECIES: hypothetical protein [Halorubrum]|jgi:hypothetical protein|uniref:Uncharacterized protein n=1 Tax=Halorubrum ezzemoulense TaxID=337243 RepID=A0ABT4Z840_HALEZ|nr:hypothetical protein [Halorubrum ezzemoulense]MDB2246070.1 hypothetical protein [Halorubrum ezzemoulense]MDB2279718.1 hypothetical protein [Halorubrum ezzemoulense]MDB2290143.1 hypothetical protein [Halorubrum ezzemoulense]MDB2294247.1 hypothetical protein [Halorubrum ezzemoulense]MDB2297694.1 hypothetical protein [Halorubrum ezzemoulense]
MVGALGVGAALVGAAIIFDTDEDHDDVVQKTVDNLEPEVPENGSLYADHLDDGYPNPRGAFTNVDNAPEDHIPDVVVTSGLKSNLIIEVETGDSIKDSSSAAKSQIEDFSIPSYKRVLVVPGADFDAVHVDEFEEHLDEEIDGEFYFATPDGVTDLL